MTRFEEIEKHLKESDESALAFCHNMKDKDIKWDVAFLRTSNRELAAAITKLSLEVQELKKNAL